MSVEAMAAVFHHSSFAGTPKVILLGIANHEGDGGAWPSVATLMKYARADRRTVQRALEKLIESGELKRLMQQGGSHHTPNSERPNLYRITIVCPDDCDRTTAHRQVSAGAAPTPPRGTHAAPGGGTHAAPGGGTHAAPGGGTHAAQTTQKPPLTSVIEKSHSGNRASGHKHSFDSTSGYCGCGYRDDGRLVDPKSGIQFQPPTAERQTS